MAMIQDLIEDSKFYVPLKVERLLLRESMIEELENGAAEDESWREPLLPLLVKLYENINTHKPATIEDKKEQIMWKHDIAIMMLNIFDAFEKSKIYSDDFKMPLKILKILYAAIIKSDFPEAGKEMAHFAYDEYKNYQSIKELNKIVSNMLDKIHKQTVHDLEQIGLYGNFDYF